MPFKISQIISFVVSMFTSWMSRNTRVWFRKVYTSVVNKCVWSITLTIELLVRWATTKPNTDRRARIWCCVWSGTVDICLFHLEMLLNCLLHAGSLSALKLKISLFTRSPNINEGIPSVIPAIIRSSPVRSDYWSRLFPFHSNMFKRWP